MSSPHVPACYWERYGMPRAGWEGKLGRPKGSGTPDWLVTTNWSCHHHRRCRGHMQAAVIGYTTNYL